MDNFPLTVGDLRRHLEAFDDAVELRFSGDLQFYWVKMRGDNLAAVEFNEPEGYLTASFRRRNPGVKVVFMALNDEGRIDVEVT